MSSCFLLFLIFLLFVCPTVSYYVFLFLGVSYVFTISYVLLFLIMSSCFLLFPGNPSAKDLRGLAKDLGGLAKDLRGLAKDLTGLAKDLRGLSKDLKGLTTGRGLIALDPPPPLL